MKVVLRNKWFIISLVFLSSTANIVRTIMSNTQKRGEILNNKDMPRVAGAFALIAEKDDINYMYIGCSMSLHDRIIDNMTKLANKRHHCTELQRLCNDGYRVYAEILEINEIMPSDSFYEIQSVITQTKIDYIEHFKRIEGIEVLNIDKPAIFSPRIYADAWTVIRAKRMMREGIPPRIVAEELGLRVKNVYKIKCGHRWRNID